METHIFFLHPYIFFMFKSYYVVWKPEAVFELFRQNCMFKSYYVVWKPREKRKQETHIIKQFKSYYVVWKLIFFVSTSRNRQSLNRTMQYGNNLRLRSPSGCILFKSYYVVWKQKMYFLSRIVVFSFKSYYVVWKLLHLIAFFFFIFLFKSYYVVWKLFTPSNTSFNSRGWFKSYYVVWKQTNK